MSAGWTELPIGCFSGINWARADAIDGFDPYLVWAEASQFAGYDRRNRPRWVPVLIELADDCSIATLERAGSRRWLRIGEIYTSNPALAALRYCTAWIAEPFFAAIEPGGVLAGKVKRFELGLPVAHHVHPPRLGTGLKLKDSEKLHGKVFGLVDGGLAFANAAFLAAMPGVSAPGARPALRARTRFFWRQDDRGTDESPRGLGYGQELRAAQIEQSIARHTYGGLVDEQAVYSEFDLPDLRKCINHGTHVLGIACAPRGVRSGIANLPPKYDGPPDWSPAGDPASRCDIIAVQLDWSNVIDTSGGSMNVSIMDALMYMLSRCADTAQLVVNISWGTLAGPHNGSSVLEAAMRQLVELRAGRLQIVLPAGNGYQDRLHANATLAPGQSMQLNWAVQPDDATQSFLELWVPSAAQLEISVRPPQGNVTVQKLRPGEARMWTDDGKKARAALIFPHRVATGTGATCALLALGPTFSFERNELTVPCGIWQVDVKNVDASPLVVDAYVERDDVALGQHTGARQSYLEDGRYDLSGNPASFVDRPVPLKKQLAATLIRRSGTFNSIGTATGTHSVGGLRMIGQGWATESLYSPRTPDPDGSRPDRTGVVRTPTEMADGDENPILLGLRGTGTLSGSVVRLVGTSGSSPQVARALFNALSTPPV